KKKAVSVLDRVLRLLACDRAKPLDVCGPCSLQAGHAAVALGLLEVPVVRRSFLLPPAVGGAARSRGQDPMSLVEARRTENRNGFRQMISENRVFPKLRLGAIAALLAVSLPLLLLAQSPGAASNPAPANDAIDVSTTTS